MMEIAGTLSVKADINTVYAEPMSTNYTTRNEVLESGKTIKYPLNGINNNYALHAFALKELPVGSEVFLLNTTLIITDEGSSVKLTIDSEKEYEYSNDVKIALANTYIKFTATEGGKYTFCYQEPAPVIP